MTKMRQIDVLAIFFACIISGSCNDAQSCDCGFNIQNRVHMGRSTKAHEYPWMAVIHIYPPEDEFVMDFGDEFLVADEEVEKPTLPIRCGGSLLDDSHIVTAAHCVGIGGNLATKPSLIKVFLGRHKQPNLESKGALQVAEVIIHPGYRDGRFINDIAILRLREKVDLDLTIAPICALKPKKDLFRENKRFVVAGWGRLGPGEEKADKLQQAKVNYVDWSYCEYTSRSYIANLLNIASNKIEKEQYVTKTHICALNAKTGADACSEDSGGPLMWYNQSQGRWSLVGIVSGSYDQCGKSTQVLGLYTDATMFYDFLRQNIPSLCSPV